MAAEVAHVPISERGPRKRIFSSKKGCKGKKKMRMMPGAGEKVKINPKMKKLYRKRAKEYNSDDDEDEDEDEAEPTTFEDRGDLKKEGGVSSEDEGDNVDAENDGFSDGEADEIQPGIANFSEGSRAFKTAFKSIIKNAVAEDALGPVLSAHKKLVAEKLAEEESERKVKGEAKKEKLMAGEKGHVKPAKYLDTHDKFLIGVATKGVVKLFNAVNKAQHAQKGLNPSRFKDEKVIKKRRKEAFFSELSKTPVSAADSKGHTSGTADEGPAWAPLRDNYMLTSSKLKDWDKMPETTIADDGMGRMSEDDGSSDEDDD